MTSPLYVLFGVLPDYISYQSIWHTGWIDIVSLQNEISSILLDLFSEQNICHTGGINMVNLQCVLLGVLQNYLFG